MFRKTESQQFTHVKSFTNSVLDRKRTHIEKHLITTYYFLFIKLYRKEILLTSNL